MAKTQTFGNVLYKSFVDDIEKDLIKHDRQIRKESAQHLAKKMKKNISRKGPSSRGDYPGWVTKNLKKGIKWRAKKVINGEEYSVVGSTASHTHLVEKGHGPDKNKNKRPFFVRTMKQESAWVEKKMKEPWID